MIYFLYNGPNINKFLFPLILLPFVEIFDTLLLNFIWCLYESMLEMPYEKSCQISIFIIFEA